MSEADNEAHLREQISADAAAGETERAVFDSTGATEADTAAGPSRSVETDLSPEEPALPGGKVATVAPSRTPQLLAAGGLVAVILFVLWRLKLRRTPPTPSERLAESARAVGAASVAAGSRAVERLSDNAGPAAERAVDLAKRGVVTGADTAQRAATAAKPVVTAAATAAKPVVTTAATVAARQGLRVGSKAVDNAGELASKATDVASDVASVAAQAGQTVGSAVADVAGSIGDAGHSVHKTYRKWTFRLWFSTFAAIGYVLGARAGRERYDQIMSLASRVTSS